MTDSTTVNVAVALLLTLAMWGAIFVACRKMWKARQTRRKIQRRLNRERGLDRLIADIRRK